MRTPTWFFLYIFGRKDNISYILLLFRVFNSCLYNCRMSNKHTYIHRSKRNMDWRFTCLHWFEFFVLSSEQIYSSCLKYLLFAEHAQRHFSFNLRWSIFTERFNSIVFRRNFNFILLLCIRLRCDYDYINRSW